MQYALRGSEKVLGRDHPSTLASVSNLAGLLQAQVCVTVNMTVKYDVKYGVKWRF